MDVSRISLLSGINEDLAVVDTADLKNNYREQLIEIYKWSYFYQQAKQAKDNLASQRVIKIATKNFNKVFDLVSEWVLKPIEEWNNQHDLKNRDLWAKSHAARYAIEKEKMGIEEDPISYLSSLGNLQIPKEEMLCGIIDIKKIEQNHLIDKFKKANTIEEKIAAINLIINSLHVSGNIMADYIEHINLLDYNYDIDDEFLEYLSNNKHYVDKWNRELQKEGIKI
jgi:hypothetical protein